MWPSAIRLRGPPSALPTRSRPPWIPSPARWNPTPRRSSRSLRRWAPSRRPRHVSRFEPIRPDEVAAFKEALAAGAANPAAAAAAAVGVQHGASARTFDGSAKHGPQSYTLLTGFEDTELPDPEQRTPPVLSGTQYGDLR